MDTDKKNYIRAGRRLTAICNPLVCQTEQRIAAPAHLNGNFPQGGTLKAEAGRLAVNRAAQIAKLLRSAFPEIF